jgi:hypothetical protein
MWDLVGEFSHHGEEYDHFEFSRVVLSTLIGALMISLLSSLLLAVIQLLKLPKLYGLYFIIWY